MKKIVYSDGSGNTWTVTETSVDYTPVTVETSSSGYYSGGTGFSKQLTAQQFNRLESAVTQAVADTNAHIQNRIKDSGCIEIHTAATVQSVIISPSSTHREIIETILKSF